MENAIEKNLLAAEGVEYARDCLLRLLTSEANLVIAGPTRSVRLSGFQSYLSAQDREAFRIVISEFPMPATASGWSVLEPTPQVSRARLLRSATQQDAGSISIDECDEECFSIFMTIVETGHFGCVTSVDAASAKLAKALIEEFLEPRISQWKTLSNSSAVDGLFPWILEVDERDSKPILHGLYKMELAGLHSAFELVESQGMSTYVRGDRAVDGRTTWQIKQDEAANKLWPISRQPRSSIPIGQVQLLQQLENRFASVKRHSWIPQVRPFANGQGGEKLQSQFGGGAWLKADESWPVCESCQNPLLNVVQLFGSDLARLRVGGLPTGALERDELLQFFYCISLSCKRDSWTAFAPGQLARRLSIHGDLVLKDSPAIPDIEKLGPVKSGRIEEWILQMDCPWPEERTHHGIELSDDENYGLSLTEGTDGREARVSFEGWELFAAQMGPELEHFGLRSQEEFKSLAKFAVPGNGDKLGGWPAWAQGVVYPSCPDCQQPMQYLLQLSSDLEPRAPGEVHFPLLFAADGLGHIFYCPQHRARLTFAWACG